MKRVLLVSAEYGSEGGGLSYSAERLKVAFERVLGYSVAAERSLPLLGGNEVVSGGYSPKLTATLSEEVWFKRCVDRYQGHVDVVIAFGGGRNGYFAMQLAQQMKVPYVISYRGSDANLARWDMTERVLAERMLRNAAGVVCLSDEQRKKVQELSGQDCRQNILVIPNVITVGRPVELRDERTRMVLGCGAAHLNEKKGVGILLRMLAELNRWCEGEARFEFVGEVDADLLHGYLELADNLGVAKQVCFIGRVHRDEFRRRIAQWDYYVQGSVCEGFSNSVADAIGLGVRVLLSPTGYIAERLSHLLPEAVFPSLEPVAMANTVLHAIGDDEMVCGYRRAYAKLAEVTAEPRVMEEWRDLLERKQITVHETVFGDDEVLAVLFHDISPGISDNITSSLEEFEAFLDYVATKGFRCCSMSERMSGHWQSERPLVLTFDDGYEGVAKYALPVLKRLGWHASVFICSSLIGETNEWNCKDKIGRRHMDAETLGRLIAEGWEIGSHGVAHQSLLKLDAAGVNVQLCQSKAMLESLLECTVSYYAYPYGDYSRFVRSEAARTYDIAFAMDNGGTHLRADRHSLRRYMPNEIRRILGE